LVNPLITAVTSSSTSRARLALLLRTRYPDVNQMPGRSHSTTTRMSFDIDSSRAALPDLVNRRLASGLLLSILFHALLLSLRFGVPGLGLPLPFTPPPISIVLAPPAPAPPAVAEPAATEAPKLPPMAAPKAGMQMVDPLPPAPAAPVVAKPKPSRPRRISRPLPPREPVESPTRVIAQDQNPNDTFVVPLPQPEESVQNTIDPKEAQEGSDDGAAAQAALLAEQKQKQELAHKLAAEAKAEREQQARLLAEKRAEESSRKLADEHKIQEQQRAALRQQQIDERAAQQQADLAAAREKVEQLARTQAALEQARRQQAEQQLAAQQKADELAQRQKAEELALKQKVEEQALKRKAEELALKQKADELAARQLAEDQARQKAAETARQQTEQAARQQAEQVARQQAEQAARQQAEHAAQRERERGASAIASAGPGNTGAGSGGTAVTVPKNLLGSDAGNRVRELTRGIDLLSGEPPQRLRPGDPRPARRAVVGAAERDVPLRMYVDSFRQKIERNGAIAVSAMSGERVRIEPLVSVAIRSDGSVEDVTIVRSSGRAEIDNAVRRIVRVNARFSVFPPNVADKYDVIEIRRIWSFAETLTLMEELR
jgi:TolA protein